MRFNTYEFLCRSGQLYVASLQFCIIGWRDSDIRHGLINDLLNTGPDLELGAEN